MTEKQHPETGELVILSTVLLRVMKSIAGPHRYSFKSRFFGGPNHLRFRRFQETPSGVPEDYLRIHEELVRMMFLECEGVENTDA